MKRALIVIASGGILAVTVAMESANAQVTRPYMAAKVGSQVAHYWIEDRGWNTLNAPRTLNTAPHFNPESPATAGWGSLGNWFSKWQW